MWVDCSRRQAARLFPIQIQERGYTLRQIDSSIGASVGTGTHAAVASCLAEKMKSGNLGNEGEDEDRGVAEFEESVKHGVRWDQVTPDLSTGQKQVVRQYRMYRLHVAPVIEPVTIERRMERMTVNGNVLTGQPDQTEDGGLEDLKTGRLARSNVAQYGGYSLLMRGEGGEVNHIRERFIQRADIRKEQPEPVTVEYSRELAENVAARIIRDVEARYADFLQSGDNMEFMANPNSMLCGENFCPAHGTTWCEEWKR